MAIGVDKKPSEKTNGTSPVALSLHVHEDARDSDSHAEASRTMGSVELCAGEDHDGRRVVGRADDASDLLGCY